MDEIFDTNKFIPLYYKTETKIKSLALVKVKKSKKSDILILENNECHGENLPSIFKYFYDLGYKPDILITDEHVKSKSTDIIKFFKPNVTIITEEQMKRVIESDVLNIYKMVFFATYNATWIPTKPIIQDFYNVKDAKYINCGYLHHLELLDRCKKHGCHVFAVANLDNQYISPEDVLIPDYFGNVKITQKNKKTNFIMVGAINSGQRNCNLLIDAVSELVDKGVKNFKVTVIGRGKLENIPKKIRKYLNIKGRLIYQKMFREMEKADFFLPLMDPENPEHDRYITKGSSGSYNLIYGFAKPCIIHRKFTLHHGLDNENSIIYDSNNELADAMQKAMTIDDETYSKMQTKLNDTHKKTYQKSLQNLKNYLNGVLNNG